MAGNFQELRARLSAEARAVSLTEHLRWVEAMSRDRLRDARELTQAEEAEDGRRPARPANDRG